ncbi:MAG: hypothetical protein MI924_16480 [Chloroflexales bacterium]|nr:hypothetical protein [Chloroflexales bacterium]
MRVLTAGSGCSAARAWQRVNRGQSSGSSFHTARWSRPGGAISPLVVDVSATYEQKRAALTEYGSIFQLTPNDRLLTLYEAEDACIGRLVGVASAEAFKSHSPLLVASPTVFLAGLHA